MEVEDTAEAASVVAEAAMSEVEAEGSAVSGGYDVRRQAVVVSGQWCRTMSQQCQHRSGIRWVAVALRRPTPQLSQSGVVR